MEKYSLVLNDMRSPNVENIGQIGPISTNRQEIVDFYKENLAEKPWRDGQWGKVFKKDSPLEWFNDGNLEEDNSYFGGVYSFRADAPDEAIRQFYLHK